MKNVSKSILLLLGMPALLAQAPAPAVPTPPLSRPAREPFRTDMSADPILQLRRQQASFEVFRDIIASAVERHPGTAENEALEDEAREILSGAREARLPNVDANLTSYRIIAREFSNDPNNIIERSRPEQRTDALLTVQQTVLDFGAGAGRVGAASARLRAAAANVEEAADRVALGAIGAWYDVFSYRALVALTESFVISQRELRGSIQERIRQGVAAEGDLARVDSYIASSQIRVARFQRLLASAEARFQELTGVPTPANLGRTPVEEAPEGSREFAAAAAARAPAVRSAEAIAESARQEARTARAEQLPQIVAGVDAGRYGVFETERDYDIRGRVAIRQRLFGGGTSRPAQFQARARSAEARATRIREEAARDASIAWSDVQALQRQLEALEAAYIASRQSRDVIVERFRVARGTLFDVLIAEEAYFESATAYIQGLTELDAARYILLSRTGKLLEHLAISPERTGA